MTAIVVLGMHRSGTSCLAGMLEAAGLAASGDAVRNWDNARGHHEMLDVVRLDEAVLAHSGGHYLAPPAEVRWTEAHAAERDRLLAARVGGRPALLKDPRLLLALPFWRASAIPFHAIGIVRHPLAVARSLASWRELPLAEGVALWTAHNRALAGDRARHGTRIVDFAAPPAAFVAAVRAALAPLGPVDEAALAAGYDPTLVHHDDADATDLPGLAEALALHAELGGASSTRPAFPRADVDAVARRLEAGDVAGAVAHARAALAAVGDAAAVLVPVVATLVRRRAHAEARALIAEHAARLDAGLAALLDGKVLLALGDAPAAVRALEAACAAPRPFFQARHLLPQALRQAGRAADARAAMQRVVREALYPHRPLATLAEWSWLDGDRAAALAQMQHAIDAAPTHRRGRLRTRRAEWLLAEGDRAAARVELERALVEDPGYTRSRTVLETLA